MTGPETEGSTSPCWYNLSMEIRLNFSLLTFFMLAQIVCSSYSVSFCASIRMWGQDLYFFPFAWSLQLGGRNKMLIRQVGLHAKERNNLCSTWPAATKPNDRHYTIKITKMCRSLVSSGSGQERTKILTDTRLTARQLLLFLFMWSGSNVLYRQIVSFLTSLCMVRLSYLSDAWP
jgi:hypothetical protein